MDIQLSYLGLLQNKSTQSIECGNYLFDNEMYNGVAHHYYYSVLQRLKHMILSFGIHDLASLEEKLEAKGSHWAVLKCIRDSTYFRSMDRRSKRDFKKHFEDLKSIREDADYSSLFHCDKPSAEEASTMCTDAHQILDEVEKKFNRQKENG